MGSISFIPVLGSISLWALNHLGSMAGPVFQDTRRTVLKYCYSFWRLFHIWAKDILATVVLAQRHFGQSYFGQRCLGQSDVSAKYTIKKGA